MRVHLLGAPGSEQPHALALGGLRWSTDPLIDGANTVETAQVSPWTSTDVEVIGGMGGQGRLVGDMWYGDLRRPFTTAGMWGLIRSLPEDSCEVKRLDGEACGARPVPTPSPAPDGRTPPDGESRAPEGGTGDRPAPPVTVAPAPEKPASGEGDARPVFGRLTVARRLSLARLRRSGLEFGVTVPREARVLRVRLVPEPGRRRTRRMTARSGASATVRLAGTGAIKVRWRLAPAAVRTLRPARYVLRVQVQGGDPGQPQLERALTLVR